MRKFNVKLLLGSSALIAGLVSAAISIHGAPRVGGDRIDSAVAKDHVISVGPMTAALSPKGQDYRQNIHFTWNGSRDSAILTYTTLTGGLWAHYYDGSTFTPGVQLAPPDGSPTSVIGDRVVHAFINTADNPSSFAAARDGDAVILFTASDYDTDGAATADGENRALYSAYFDYTHRTSISKSYGFQKTGVRISAEDELNENVICHGIVTDGLSGEARWLNYQYRYAYGDATSGLAVFWTQAVNVDGDSFVEDLATYAAFFNLAQAGSAELPLAAGPEARVATSNFGASDSGTTAHRTRTEARYIVYNNLLFLRCAANVSGLGSEPELWDFGSPMNEGDDITIQCVAFDFDTMTFGGAHVVHGAMPDAADTKENNAMPVRQDGSFLSGGHSVYGGDEGLARVEIVLAELADGQAGVTWGTASHNARLAAAEINPTTGAVMGHVFLDIEDPDITDNVGSTAVDLRLSRNGDFIFVGWIETRHAGGLDDKALWAAQITTVRGGAPEVFSERVGTAIPVNMDIDDFPVGWFFFEEGLEYVTGAQSNASVMNIIYEQGCHTDDEIWCARLTADLTPGPTVFDPAIGIIEIFEDGAQPGMGLLNQEHWGCNATDRGTDGHPIAFYIKDSDAGTAVNLSLYAQKVGPSGATCRIDRPSTGSTVPMQSIALALTQAGSEIGTTSSPAEIAKRTWSHDRVHAIWMEGRNLTTGVWEGTGLWTRYFSVGSTATAFPDQFTPSAASTPLGTLRPIQLDPLGTLPSVDDTQDVQGIARKGGNAGVWFTTRSHIYYQEFQYTAFGWGWDVTLGGGLYGVPVRIDDAPVISSRKRTYGLAKNTNPGAVAKSVGPMKAFFPHPGTGNTLDRALYFWTKDSYDDGFPLLYGRARNKD